MMGRSKDHWSAGLWWSLLLSGGSLGGHGKPLKSFQSLIVTFVPNGATVDYSLVLIWAAMVDLLVFSAIVSSSPSLAAAGAAADRFVIKFVMECWVIHRGPLDNVEDQPPSSFLILGWCCGRPFSLVYFPYLMANGEDQFFTIMIQPWESDGVLEMFPFTASSTVPRDEGKMAFPRQPFSLFFFESF
uniref:Very-long-chain (3R)-3-hydroxyacyl-CoA dehydratase n=1 Tax=Fagus sylvatica TaxID=28930 RepID=A0A2N9ENW0_FAGSY